MDTRVKPAYDTRGDRKMPYADVNGARLSYESLGEGTPLLFIHGGYGGAGSTLAPQPQAIRNVAPRDKVRTIVYDRRNAEGDGLLIYTFPRPGR